jgi:hypothetical protein
MIQPAMLSQMLTIDQFGPSFRFPSRFTGMGTGSKDEAVTHPSFSARYAEAAVVVVEGDALDDAGDLLGRGSALWHGGGHEWGFILPRMRDLGDSVRWKPREVES